MSGLRKTSPRYVRCWLYPSGSELLPSKVTSVRVIFFGEKRLPPFLTARCLRVTGVGGSSGGKGSLLSVGLREVVCSLTRQRAQILRFEKTSPPLAVVSRGCFLLCICFGGVE